MTAISNIFSRTYAHPKADCILYRGLMTYTVLELEEIWLGLMVPIDGKIRTSGDAFLVAADGYPCGIVWYTSKKMCVEQLCDFSQDRWGVWQVAIPDPISNPESVISTAFFLRSLLLSHWESWLRFPISLS